MKKLLIALSFAVCVVSAANAQKKPMGTPEERAAKSIDRMSDLNLTADQKAKLTVIYVAQAKSVDSLRATGGDAEAMKEKMGPIQKSIRKQVNSVLTDDQKKTMASKMGEGKPKKPAGGDEN